MEQTLLDNIKEYLSDLIITGEIKRGGQKVVFSSYYKDNIKTVFKVVQAQQSDEKSRALREIDILSKLESEYFPKLYDYGEYTDSKESVLYIVEEYINGQNLRDFINKSKPDKLELSECRRVISSLIDALIIIEPLRIVHRDIKPENIIVSHSRVVLIDFGIAREISKLSLTDTFAVFGPMTPGYAPPEQIKNEKRKISFRTDLFSIAVVFYEILTGFNPFYMGTKSMNEVLGKTISSCPQSLTSNGFNKTFDDFVFKCLEKNCHLRPSSLKNAKSLFNNINWED